MSEKTLIFKVSDVKNLHYAWKKLNKYNKYSRGVDGVTIEQFTSNLEENLSNISRELRQGKYRFSPNRAVAIQKPNKKFRPLQIPVIRDRVVLKAIAIELENQFRDVFQRSAGISFAYQRKLGIREAFQKIEEHYSHGSKVILEADIVNFFGEVNRNSLLNDIVFPRLTDDTLNNLIQDGLNQSIQGVEHLPSDQAEAFDGIGNGIPQGNPLSPLLSNIYLEPFDSFMRTNKHKMVRYADDFVVMCNSKENALNVFNDCKSYLKDNLDLDIYDLGDKSSITNPETDEFIFLSIQFDGKKKFPSRENVEKFKNKIRSVTNIASDETSVIKLLTKVKNRYEGWLSAFFFTDVDRYEKELDFYLDRQLFLSLSKMEWKFSSGSKGELPHAYRHPGESADCLSNLQRLNSGVPMMMDHLNRVRKENEEEEISIEPDKDHNINHQIIDTDEQPGFWRRLFKALKL